MIIIFGPAGSGKSLQGQILAARNNWRWLSAGQMLRDKRDPQITAVMHEGRLVDPAIVNIVVKEALERSSDIDRVILDGFPRMLEQTKWLVEETNDGRNIGAVIVLDVARDILHERLRIRGRLDDEREAIEKRLDDYEQEISPILDYLESKGVRVIQVDGSGRVGEIHDLITEELKKCNLA